MDDLKTRYAFLVEWFDTHAQLTREYEFLFYPGDATIEMYDKKQRRTFLKRTKSSFKLQDLFIGGRIVVHARQLTIKDYGDEYTRKTLGVELESSLALIPPNSLAKLGEIIDTLTSKQYTLLRAKLFKLSPSLAERLLGGDGDLKQSFSNGNVVALELLKGKAVQELAELSESGSFFAPKSKDGLQEKLDAVFSPENHATNSFENSTLAIVRPHALIDGSAGKIVDAIIKGGFQITNLELFRLDRANAEEFLEVYKGVVPEYHLMVDQLTSGPLIAIQIFGGNDIVSKFREFVGPSDPELAKQLRPNSLRAKFGLDKVRNGVHCTDLPEDGILESEYFFKIL